MRLYCNLNEECNLDVLWVPSEAAPFLDGAPNSLRMAVGIVFSGVTLNLTGEIPSLLSRIAARSVLRARRADFPLP